MTTQRTSDLRLSVDADSSLTITALTPRGQQAIGKAAGRRRGGAWEMTPHWCIGADVAPAFVLALLAQDVVIHAGGTQ